MAVIANLDIVLGAQTTQLAGGLNTGKRLLLDFTNNAQRIGQFQAAGGLLTQLPIIGDRFGAVGRLAGEAGGLVKGFGASGALLGPVALGFAGVVGGALAAKAAIGAAMAQFDAIDSGADAAKKLGLSYRDLTVARLGFGEATGLDSGAIDGALEKFSSNLATAATKGTGPAAEALKRLGLDAGDLLATGPLGAIEKIGERTGELTNRTEQLKVAMDLFGQSGGAMVGALREGPGLLQEMGDFAERAGLALSDAQAEQIGAANDAWGRVEMVATGAFQQIAVASAPVLTALLDNVLAVAGPVSSWAGYLEPAVEGMAYLGGLTWDVLEATTATSRAISKMTSLDFAGAGEVVSNAADFGTGGRLVDQIRQAKADAAEAAEASAGSFGAIASAEADVAAETDKAAKAQEQLAESVRSRVDALKEEVQVLRVGKDAAERLQTMKDVVNAGLGSDTRDELLGLMDAKRQLEEAQKAKEEAAKRAETDKQAAESVRDSTRTGEERLADRLSELQRLVSVGALDGETAARAGADALADFNKAEGPDAQAAPSVGALEGVAAYSAALKNDAASRGADLAAQGNKLTERTNELLVEVVGVIKANELVGV